jgi:outer membrane biosynthesis protein TonB
VIRFDRTPKNGVEMLVSSADGRIQRLEPLAASGTRAADRAAQAAAKADDGAEPADAQAGE